VSDTRRDRKRRSAEHWHDPDVLGPVLEDHHAARQWLCQRRIDYDPGRWLRFRAGYDARRRRTAGCCGVESVTRSGLRESTGVAHQGDHRKQRSPLRPRTGNTVDREG
jgi:hypothetical protein